MSSGQSMMLIPDPAIKYSEQYYTVSKKTKILPMTPRMTVFFIIITTWCVMYVWFTPLRHTG